LVTGHPENAEPFLDFLQRVSEAIDIITTYQQELRSGRVLVVSHATIIRAFRFIASLETKIETQEQLQAATAGFFYYQNGNFIKIPHGMVNIRSML
jgi:broad specificity phosphatase PhoE